MSDYKINLDNRTESKFSLFMFHLCFISCIRAGKMEAKSLTNRGGRYSGTD